MYLRSLWGEDNTSLFTGQRKIAPISELELGWKLGSEIIAVLNPLVPAVLQE